MWIEIEDLPKGDPLFGECTSHVPGLHESIDADEMAYLMRKAARGEYVGFETLGELGPRDGETILSLYHRAIQILPEIKDLGFSVPEIFDFMEHFSIQSGKAVKDVVLRLKKMGCTTLQEMTRTLEEFPSLLS